MTAVRLLGVLALVAAAISARGAPGVISPGAVVLKNANGVEAHVLPTGACVQRLLVPDRDGKVTDVMLGFEDVEQYKNGTSPSGCIMGRIGGRTSGAKFTLDGKTYKLDGNSNGGKDTIHGGGIGYNRVKWTVVYSSPTKAKLKYTSPDGEQGFPGALSLRVTYKLTEENEFIMDITGTTTKATPLSIFSHPYFNLAGFADNATVLDHLLTIHEGDYYTPTSGKSVPTGEMEPVNGTALDFTSQHAIGERIDELAEEGGYSTSYVLFGNGANVKKEVKGFVAADPANYAATLVHPGSGRGLDLLTTAPALMLYTGNAFSGKWSGKDGVKYQKWAAVALETTMFPDAINQPTFPSNVLRPGQLFRQTTVWRLFRATRDGREDGTLRSCAAASPNCKKCKPGNVERCSVCKVTYKLSKGKCIKQKAM